MSALSGQNTNYGAPLLSVLWARNAQLLGLEGEEVREKIIAVYDPTVCKAKS